MIISSPKISDIPRLKELFTQAFSDDGSFLDTFFKVAFSTNRARVIYKDETIVAMLYWFDCEYNEGKLAYIYAVATDKSSRGQGLCRALMENTHEHLKSLGYLGAILVPSEISLFDFYNKLGYNSCSYIEEFCSQSATQGCNISKIDKEEYARLRKSYLPLNSVVQENESLDFLDSLASFIKGDDFILSYAIYEGCLHAFELLGNKEKAPNILSTLEIKTGTFRTAGNRRPFTMLYPFKEMTPPNYFAFAFD